MEEIKDSWSKVNRDPKLLTLIQLLKTNKILKMRKIIIFSESKETVEYLTRELNNVFPSKVIAFTGESENHIKNKIIENFNAKASKQKDDYRLLVTTDVLSEGVNLHRSNVVINYDIPWNPTKVMQRVGRINRVGTVFDKLYIFNFFPTEQSNDQIKLKESAEGKIHAFITLLGADAKLLTEDEAVESHELFDKLLSKKSITGEEDIDESELKYFKEIKEIRDKDSNLFDKIKKIPKKSRSAKIYDGDKNRLLTYFRKGKLQKFYISDGTNCKELDFITAASYLKSHPGDKRQRLPKEFYEKLKSNKEAFTLATTEELNQMPMKRGKNTLEQVYGMLKASFKDTRQLTEEQIALYRRVLEQFEKGAIPEPIAKNIKKDFKKYVNEGNLDSLKAIEILKRDVPSEFLQDHIAESSTNTHEPNEVILSLYLDGR